MALRNPRPGVWTPSGLSDGYDASELPAGAMAMLANILPQPNNKGVWVPRPAATQVATIPDFGGVAGNNVRGVIEVGDIQYGFAPSLAFPGKDRPFAYNMNTGTFLAIAGLTSANLPATQPLTGEIVPPTIAVVGSRVVFTHPGFAGGMSTPPSFLQMFANVHNGSTILDGNAYIAGIGNVTLPTVGVGLYGTGIPVGATVVSAKAVTVVTTATGTSGTPTVVVADATGLAIGQQCTVGNGAAGPATLAIASGATVTMSLPGTASSNGVTVTAAGGATAYKFGWLDASGFTLSTLGNVTSGSPIVTGNPTLAGIQPGMPIVGAGIPANTVVRSAAPLVITATGTTSSGSPDITNVVVSTPLGALPVPGQLVFGLGVPLGAAISRIASPTVTMSRNATASGTVSLTFLGSLIAMSVPGTMDANAVALTIAGGTQAAPLWGAGDTNINNLVGVPIFVSQFYGRAYFGINTANPITAGVTASDAGIACQVSNANQAITFSDGIPVTAGQGLALENQLGGVIQSLMVFQGASNIRQISGDFALGTWAQNSLQTATGTLAPNSIASTPQGLMFAAPDGLRLIDFNARVSEPIGWRGEGMSLPFINAVTPSRMAASYNENVYRISVIWHPPPTAQGVWGAAQRQDEFWVHLDIKKWSGPHSFPSDQSTAWQTVNSFAIMPSAIPGTIWRSDAVPSAAATYVENGVQLTWRFETPLLPDNPEQMAVELNESSIFFSYGPADQAIVTATGDDGIVMDQIYLWMGPLVTAQQYPLWWNLKLVYRQFSLLIAGKSTAQLQLGRLNLRQQLLGYQLIPDYVPEFILGPDGTPVGHDPLGP